MISHRTLRPAAIVLACLFLVTTACGADDAAQPGGTGGPTGTNTGDGPQIVRVEEDVDYYGACGNEILTLGDETFYPLLPEERDRLIADHPEPSDGTDLSSLRSAIRVMPPGHGDATGTLAVYSDDIARFESDSGRVIWLIADERSYDWVC